MKNTLDDLNNYLFESIERLNDDSADLDMEIKRSEAIQKVAQKIIESGKLKLDARKHFDEYGSGNEIGMSFLGIETSKKYERDK